MDMHLEFKHNSATVNFFYNIRFTITSVGVELKTDLLDCINCEPLRTNVMWEMNRSAKLAEFLITSK